MTQFLKRFSLARSLFWLAVAGLAYFFGWIYSVAFVSLCSLYANIASDFAAYRADDNKEILERLERIERQIKQLVEPKEGDKEDR